MNYIITLNNKQYTFDTADELYIFGIGIENNVENKLGIDVIQFVKFVYDCYATDCFNAPLQRFTLFIIKWWKEMHEHEKLYIVNKYYEIQDM